ncbi:MAG: tRNA lysidine(34) synthetase TilS, partial [Planctomycetota bacterium]|nr:tRNA lysidine(34) synthetase TilS [Planctomycetota bacterium]
MATAAPPLIDVALAGARGVGLCPGDRVVVGVSAGADSTALACLLRALAAHGLPLDLVLVYVDHGWRGPAAAEADAAAVEALGQRLGVPVRRSPPPPPEVPQAEDAARRHRYVELTRAAQAVGATVVAVAHHLGDQAETLVMRAMRGSGPYGVAGMPARRRLGDAGIQLVRPLLAVHPDALRAWLESHSVSWRE